MPSAVLLALVVQAHTPAADDSVRPPTATTATAVRTVHAPLIDGRDDDEVWRTAPAITQFREFQPKEDGDPRFPTEAKVAYDDRNIYVFIRAFDPHPDSILKLLARRDVRAATDQLKIMIDSYHDRRSGYEFAVNPAGVKRDYAIYNDQQEDDAWDAVWEVATAVDSLGWAAEFRIPLSQLRYVPRGTNTFGFGVWRDIQRYPERVSWPVYRNSQAGISSQLGELTGLVGLPSPRRPEVAPYVVTKNVSVPTGTSFDRSQKLTAGADLKYGLTPNLTLDGTVNPDFGQVEADPAVLNLTVFESFFQERRPFFVQGAGIFRFDVNCNQVNCNSEGLFYSRRIGRAPELRDGDPESPTATTIYGAAKLTGRLRGGQTVGVLDAVTERAAGTLDRTVEPTTNYAVVRTQQDFRNGESGIGLMFTAVNRSLDRWTDSLLRRSAYVSALDFRHRFLRSHYQISGSFDLSRLTGTAAAIALTQRDPVHYYQRPGAGASYDPTRTSLAGDAEELLFGKVGGGVTAGQLGTTFCDRNCSRGGPAVRADPYLSAWGEVDGDARPPLVPSVWFNYWRGDGGRSEKFNGNTQITFRVASQVNAAVTLSATHNVNDVQPHGTIADSAGVHFTFAHLNQKTVSLTGRVDYTLSTVLTLQLYAQPFISKGTYSSLRELADPNAAAFDNRYKPYAATPDGFNDKEFNSTAVLRWEYRPGSTLFVVWTQGRTDYAPLEGPRSLAGNLRDLFDLHPKNTFLVKASYWIAW